MTATPDPSAVEAARLRFAQEVLDERPSPKVRAAVLRAAAEAAGGQRADHSAPATRRRAGKRWLQWPSLAAAGTAAIALLAVGISLHLEHEAPVEQRFEAPAAPLQSAPPATAPSVPAPARAPETPSLAREPALRSRAVAPAEPLSKAAAPLSKVAPESKTTASAPTPSASDRVAGTAAAARSAPAPAMPPAEAAPSAIAPATAGSAAMQAPRDQIEEAKPDSTTLERSSNAPPALTSPAPVSHLKAAPAKQLAAPDEWLRRIIELRRAGRDSEADDELARFRAAFPNVTVPAEAMK